LYLRSNATMDAMVVVTVYEPSTVSTFSLILMSGFLFG